MDIFNIDEDSLEYEISEHLEKIVNNSNSLNELEKDIKELDIFNKLEAASLDILESKLIFLQKIIESVS